LVDGAEKAERKVRKMMKSYEVKKMGFEVMAEICAVVEEMEIDAFASADEARENGDDVSADKWHVRAEFLLKALTALENQGAEMPWFTDKVWNRYFDQNCQF